MVSVVNYFAQMSYLEVEVETLTEQLHSPEVCEEDQNGSVTVDDLVHIQKVNRELEQQLGDKNRVSRLFLPILLFCTHLHTSRYKITSCKRSIVLQTIKQLQQRLAELKRTLQKELVRHSESHQCFFVFFYSLCSMSANGTFGDEAALILQGSDVIWSRGVR